MNHKRIISLILSVLLILSAIALPVYAADEEITAEDTYVLNRNSNGDYLYQFTSPCMLGYDFNNQYAPNSISIQAFVFTMYNSITGEHFPTYCADINVTAVQGADYHRLNLEDSAFSANAAGMIRAILQEGFYVIPIKGESDADFAARVAAKVDELAAASGAEGLTVGEAIAATQAAIWRTVHGPELAFPKFCRSVYKPSQTKYLDLCSYDQLRLKANADINATIETVYDYLLSLDPISEHETTVDPASFTDLNDPIFTQNPDGTYNVTVNTTVYVELHEGDTLTMKATLGPYAKKVSLKDGEQDITVTLENVPAELIRQEVKLSIYGYQTSKGYFLFDAKGARQDSQTMIGYNNSRLPVYAEVVSKEDRVLTLFKSTSIKTGENTYESVPLSGISFDLYLVATMEEYQTGAITLPENAAECPIPDKDNIADYILVTDENGRASINLLHFGLPDGVYLLIEHRHPNIVAPYPPTYVYIPSTDPDTREPLYQVLKKPKNEVKGGVTIEKDVISIGNNSATLDAYEPHTWIVGCSVPEDILSGTSYTVSDTLDNRLDYLGNLKVALENASSTTELIPDTDYKLTVTDVNSLSEGKPSDAFTLRLTVAGMHKIANTIGSNSFTDYKLRIYFDAQINANAEMGADIPNQAKLEYVNAVNFKFSVTSDIPVVCTGGIRLLKVDAEDAANTLAGAKFELYRPATLDEISSNDPRMTQIAGVSEKVIKISFCNTPVPQEEKVDFVITEEDGLVCISGLAFGKYYLMETKAPDGYNPLREAIELLVDTESHLEENTNIITNVSGTVLPSTGGIGTTLFAVGGIFLICLAAFLLILNKRKAANT